MKKYKKLLISIVIISILTIMFIFWDTPINEKYECIEFNLDSNSFTKVNVTITGELKKSLLRKDFARLNITIGDTQIPNLKKYPHILPLMYNGEVASYSENKDVEILFEGTDAMEEYIEDYGNYYRINLRYDYFDKKSFEEGYENIGKLYIAKDFKNIFITINKKIKQGSYSWNSDNGKIISSQPNIDSSKKLLQDILKYQ